MLEHRYLTGPEGSANGQLLSFTGLPRNGRGYPVSGHCAAKLLSHRDRTRMPQFYIAVADQVRDKSAIDESQDFGLVGKQEPEQ